MNQNHTDNMPYRYTLSLSLASEVAPLNEADQEALRKGIEEYNNRSTYMANKKAIELLSIEDHEFRIKLWSASPLTVPGRAMRSLTAILLKDPDSRFAHRVLRGQLLRVLKVTPDEEGSGGDTAQPNLAQISDTDLIVALLRYTEEKRDGSHRSQVQRDAMEAIKKIALDAGMITAAGK